MLSTSEYQRLLAVARGHALPEEGDDEDDDDFVPESDGDGDAAALNDESPKQAATPGPCRPTSPENNVSVSVLTAHAFACRLAWSLSNSSSSPAGFRFRCRSASCRT